MPNSTRGPITNPVTQQSLRLWDKFRDLFKLISPHPPLFSFFNHPSFYPAFMDPTSFQVWAQSGLQRIRDLVTSDTLQTFPALQTQAQLSSNECFCYFQISHFIRTIIGTHTSLDSLSLYLGICNSDPHARASFPVYTATSHPIQLASHHMLLNGPRT